MRGIEKLDLFKNEDEERREEIRFDQVLDRKKGWITASSVPDNWDKVVKINYQYNGFRVFLAQDRNGTTMICRMKV